MQPEENYLLAEDLREKFALEILGLGSCLAAYVRPDAFDESEARAVVDSVKGLYNRMTDAQATAWAAKTAGNRWFLLSYRGG